MKDAREALHGVGIIVCDRNAQSAYPDKGKAFEFCLIFFKFQIASIIFFLKITIVLTSF